MNHTLQKILFSALLIGSGSCMAATDLRTVVDASVEPLMQQQGIPGLSVAVVNQGKVQYFNYGVASRETKQAVNQDLSLIHI